MDSRVGWGRGRIKAEVGHGEEEVGTGEEGVGTGEEEVGHGEEEVGTGKRIKCIFILSHHELMFSI